MAAARGAHYGLYLDTMKGIILAGGKGTRLLPATRVMNKHMIPIRNYPMILYPLSTLVRGFGIHDILIVTGGDHVGAFAEFLGDGSVYETALTYRVQKEAGGIAQALLLAEAFSGGEQVVVILGDNIFEHEPIQTEVLSRDHAHLFLKDVPDPQRFGVATLSEGRVSSIVEKPVTPESPYAVTGLYVYPPDVYERIKVLKPSARNELEITDVNNSYVAQKRCTAHILTGFWSDAGTPASLARTIEWAEEAAPPFE